MALLILLAVCLAVGGCGGGSDNSTSPLDDALGYFAKDAPLVAAVTTDPQDPQLQRLSTYTSGLVGAAIVERVTAITRLHFVEFERDVKPQLGAPLVVGLERPAGGMKGIGTAMVVAVRIKHPLQAKQVLLRQPNVRGEGKSSGARIYADDLDSRYFAVDGSVLVAAANRDTLERALAVKRGDNRMRQKDFAKALEHLPAGGLVRVAADPRELIAADRRLRPALGVKWLASMRRLGAVVSSTSSGLTLNFHLSTDGGRLSDADLPLGTSAGALPLIGMSGEIQAALADPGRLVRLGFGLWRAVAPASLNRFRKLEPRGVDLERQLPHHLAGNAALAYDPVTHTFAARAALTDAADVRAALGPLAPALPGLAAALGVNGVGYATPTQGESFYALAKPDGSTAVFGVVGKSLVLASDPPRAAALASARSHAAPHAVKGAAILTLDARQLATNYLAKRLHGAAALLGPLVTQPLRDLTGTLTNNRNGLDGRFTLTIVK